MRKFFTTIGLILTLYGSFAQTLVNGTITNQIINQPVNGPLLNLYVSLVHLNSGNPNDLVLISVAPVGTDGTYNLNDPINTVFGSYKLVLSNNPFGSLISNLPPGFIWFEDYNDPAPDGISGTFLLSKPLCTGDVGDPEYDACMAYIPTLNNANFKLSQLPLIGSPTISSNSPVCEGQTLIITATSSDESYPITVTGPNGQIISDFSIENVTQANAGMYTVTMEVFGNIQVYSEITTVVINPLPPNITFTSGSTTLNSNSPNETYATDAPNTYTVSYSISPSNAGTISTTGVVDWENTFTGQATITASITNTCGTKTALRPVQISGPLFTPATLVSNSPVCEGGTLTLIVQNDANVPYSITGPNGQAVSNLTITGVTLASAGTYTITSNDGIGGPSFSNTLNVFVNSNLNDLLFLGGSMVINQNAPNLIYFTNAPNESTVTFSISPQTAGTITNLGEVDWNVNFSGNAIISTTVTNVCASKTITREVTVIPTVINYFLSDTPVCEKENLNLRLFLSVPNTNYTITDPGGNILPFVAPNEFNLIVATINYANINQAGIYSAVLETGATATTTVVVNPLPPTITFTIGSTSLNINAPNETYATDAPNAFTVSYSISPSNAGTISTTGVVDWENTFTGQATITASITNTCGTKTATRIVDILAPKLYSLGNTVFHDANKNGMHDNGEVGIPGLTVTIYQSDGVTQINNTSTDGNGNYLFENLIAGDYRVGVTPSAQYSVSSNDTPNTNTDNQIDMDDNGIQTSFGTDALSPVINLSAADGTGDLTIDFGFHMPSPLNAPASFTSNSPVCEGQSLIFTVDNPAPETVSYTITGPNGQVGETLNNVTVSYAGTYTITSFNTSSGDPIGDQSITVVINPLPPTIAFTSGAINLGVNAPNETYATDAPNTYTVTYSISPSNAGTISATGEVDWENTFTGQATITASITNTCGTITAMRLVQISAPLFTPATLASNSPVCEGGTLTLIVQNEADVPYSITGPNGQAITNLSILNVTLASAGTYTITSGDGISNFGSETTIIAINPLPPTITFTSGATTLNSNAPNETYATDAPNTYTVSYSISPSNAGTISTAGVVDWENTFTGQASITASITNTCGTKTAIRIVQINCVAPLFTVGLSSNSPLCFGQTLVLTPDIDRDGPQEYMITGPNNLPSFETILNTTASNAGTYTISVVNGCGNTISQSINVVINPIPTIITFTSGATTLNQDASNEIYATDAPNTFTVSYAISPSNAGTISATGEVDWNSTFYGTATIIASISNTCGNQSATKSVLINQVFPVINCPTNILIPVSIGTTSAIANFSLPTVAGASVSQAAGLSSGSSFPLGNTTISFVATNSLGNTASCSFIVAVYPETAPLVENSQIPNATPDPVTGNYSISSTIFDVTVPSGEVISGLLITTFPAGAESITINGITYGPPTAGGRIKYGRSNLALVPFPPGGVIAQTNDAGVPEQPILVNPITGSNQIIIEFFAINGANIQSPLPATVAVNFATAPLPISLHSFNAKQENEAVLLNWHTTFETNFSHFEIQKSGTSKEFGSIGKVKGNNQDFYNFTDTNPIEGNNYYRLKMVDFDGTMSLSKTVVINYEKNGYYFTVENPAKGGAFMVRSNYFDPSFTLLNSLGQKIEGSVSKINASQYQFNLKNKGSGIYFIMLQSESKIITQKLIIEN